nr:type II toxin-antitoxin system RelE/ParE family toxin [uncultured Treponema sp.]
MEKTGQRNSAGVNGESTTLFNQNGNWRVTFYFEGQDAILVDYQDYH